MNYNFKKMPTKTAIIEERDELIQKLKDGGLGRHMFRSETDAKKGHAWLYSRFIPIPEIKNWLDIAGTGESDDCQWLMCWEWPAKKVTVDEVEIALLLEAMEVCDLYIDTHGVDDAKRAAMLKLYNKLKV